MDLLSCSFNQDYGCFVSGTSSGFAIFNCEPFREEHKRDFDNEGVGSAEMLFRSNILALVGGGSNPRFPPTKVMIWDDHQGRCIGELGFKSQVRAVKLRRDNIAVALEHKVLIYNFADLKLLHNIETSTNTLGLLALSAAAENTVLSCPGLNTGQIRIELYDVRRTKFIQAHSTALACIALSLDGKLLATASERGTLVRIFSTADATMLQVRPNGLQVTTHIDPKNLEKELRRGADPACIFSIAFSKDEKPDWLAISSDKGTVHVFSLQHRGQAAIDSAPNGLPERAESSARNPLSSLSFVSSLLPVPYFKSERSFAQFRLPEEAKAIVGFGQQPNTVVVVTMKGSFFIASFDPVKGGSCSQIAFQTFFEPSVARV